MQELAGVSKVCCLQTPLCLSRTVTQSSWQPNKLAPAVASLMTATLRRKKTALLLLVLAASALLPTFSPRVRPATLTADSWMCMDFYAYDMLPWRPVPQEGLSFKMSRRAMERMPS